MLKADDLLGLTTGLVRAYVSRNQLTKSEVPTLISSIHNTLTGLHDTRAGLPASKAVPEQAPITRKATPAQVRKSIAVEYLVSFENGERYRSLKRHLTTLGMTPESYRSKWGLPQDYPMVSPAYSSTRSAIAKSYGFGKASVGRPRKVVG